MLPAARLAGLVLSALLLLTGFILPALLLAGLPRLILSALLWIARVLFVCHRDVLRCEPPPDYDNPRFCRRFRRGAALFISSTLIPL
jgi:hypothetical protein